MIEAGAKRNPASTRTMVRVANVAQREIFGLPLTPNGTTAISYVSTWEGAIEVGVQYDVYAPTFKSQWVNQVALCAHDHGEDSIFCVLEDADGARAYIVYYVPKDDFIRWDAVA